MVQYARIEERSASLATEFGETFARKHFGDAIVDALPKITRGPRKGSISGMINWKKCVIGGWVNQPGRSGVTRPGVSDVSLHTKNERYLDPRSFMTEETYARWNDLGRPLWKPSEPIRDMEERWGVTADRRARIAAEFAATSN